jgi:hypothetical protein
MGNIVLATGKFNPGHLSYLSSAATLWDKLVEVQYGSSCEETDTERKGIT